MSDFGAVDTFGLSEGDADGSEHCMHPHGTEKHVEEELNMSLSRLVVVDVGPEENRSGGDSVVVAGNDVHHLWSPLVAVSHDEA